MFCGIAGCRRSSRDLNLPGKVAEPERRGLADSVRRYTVQQIADEFGVTRPTTYRHLATA
jgi:Bacterial regulatory protein, arsR family